MKTWVTRNSPEYAAAWSESDQGPRNNYGVYLDSPLMQSPAYWQNLGYTGQMTPNMSESGGGELDMSGVQQWMDRNNFRLGYNQDSETNALLDANGNAMAGSEYSVDDTGDFMRDAVLLMAGGYFGGNALSGAYGGAAGGASTAAMANGAVAGGATGTGVGGAAAAGYGGAAAGGAAAESAFRPSQNYGEGMTGGETSAYDTAIKSGGNMASNNAGTSLGDFVSGNGSWQDYLRAGQAAYGMYAQDRATDAASAGNAANLALQTRMYEENKALNQPLVDMRNSVLPQIQNLLANPSSITQDPGYKFQRDQGFNALNNRAAASGNYYSGQQMKAAQQYGQDYAGTKLDQSLNRLMGVATGSQVGANNMQQNAGNYAVGGGNALQQGGNIRAGGYIGQYNTVNNNVNDWMQDQYNQKYWGGGK